MTSNIKTNYGKNCIVHIGLHKRCRGLVYYAKKTYIFIDVIALCRPAELEQKDLHK